MAGVALSNYLAGGCGAWVYSGHRLTGQIPPLSRRRLNLIRCVGESSDSATSRPISEKVPLKDANSNGVAFVGQEDVPLEGVIQFEKPNSTSFLAKWGRVALLACGDVSALLLFTAVGKISHGFPVFELSTLQTADPFIAGWLLSAYFLGGYGDDGKGKNGVTAGITAAAKSWAVGIPLGLIIRGVTKGQVPPTGFILVTMGSTAVLMIGWRALLLSIWPSKKNDDYKQGSPFELFELLTSLVRRW